MATVVILVPSGDMIVERRGDKEEILVGPRTKERCNKAGLLAQRRLRQGDTVVVITSGVHAQDGELIHDAGHMGSSLTPILPESERLILHVGHALSFHTFANIAEWVRILKARQWWEETELIVISERRHTWRIWLSFVLGYWRWVDRHPTSTILSHKEKAGELVLAVLHVIDPRGWVSGPLFYRQRCPRLLRRAIRQGRVQRG